MSRTHIVFGDVHCHPEHNNDRADLLSKLIIDVSPEVVINLGDQADMASLSSYDRGKASFIGRTYRDDVEVSRDFSERLWSPIRKRKKRLPYRLFLIGNHEQRIARALDLQSNLNGTIGYGDLALSEYYDNVVDYNGNTPGTINIDGLLYAHYFISGISGRPISSDVSPASALVSKNLVSSTCGHSHLFDYSVRNSANGNKLNGLVTGCFVDYDIGWAGESNKLWTRGVAICHDVENGNYDLEWVSLERLRKEYG